jgi:hypothetical protein
MKYTTRPFLIPVAPPLAEVLAEAEVLAAAEVLAGALELELELELELLELHAAMVVTAVTAAKASTAGLRTAAICDLL